MIQAEDLRIGNLIINPIQGIIKVDTRVIDKINALRLPIKQGLLTKEDMFQPIPITEDILLKVGFEYNDFDFFYSLHYIDFRLEFNFVEQFEFWLNDIAIRIKYFHELQNLYYALTKQELDITKILEDGNSL